MADFRVLTFVTSHEIYDEMRRTFEAGGFRDPHVAYQVIDNSESNVHEPYGVVNEVLASMDEDYLIVCHQDIRLDDGTSLETLRAQIAKADAEHPNWAVLGSAGLDMHYRQVLCVKDPWQVPPWPGPWPVEAETLDELFLLIKRGGAELTPGLHGFHFYAADLCLSARRNGRRALVINFPLIHLSNGEGGRLSDEYGRARVAFQERLSPFYACNLVVTTTYESAMLSRYRVVRWIGKRRRVRRLMQKIFGGLLVA